MSEVTPGIDDRLEHEARARILEYARAFRTIPGWFDWEDVLLFQKIDDLQRRDGLGGDFLEIGVYHGKSAILLGYLRQDGERLVVCDLFETATPATPANRTENTLYEGCTRETFERTYRRFHEDLPTILACASTAGALHTLPRQFRFIHIDGSHLYDIVRADIQTAKSLLIPGGVVAFDDFQNPSAPGVTAAVFEEVLQGGLVPLCFTRKLYAAWDSGAAARVGALGEWASRHPLLQATTHVIFDREVVHLTGRERTPTAPQTPSWFWKLVRLAIPPGLFVLGDLLRRCARSRRSNRLLERDATPHRHPEMHNPRPVAEHSTSRPRSAPAEPES